MNAFSFKSIPGQITVDDAEGIVECFVAGIGNKDSVGDICAPGCFSSSLRRRVPRVVWGHDWNHPIGKVLDIYEVGPNDTRLPRKMRDAGIGGLYARVQFNLNSEKGREAFANVSFFGMDQEWSIGYKTLDAIYDNARQANVLKEVELYEVSPVLHGANQLTGTISIKSDSAVLDDIDEKASKQPLKDPKGGLTAAGRAHFRRTQGANLKPGVKGPADTPQKMRRKGSFLTRFFTNPSGPMIGDNGKPTRLALSAAAWGEPVPKNMDDARELAAKGRRLLERYQNSKEKGADGQIDYDIYPDRMLVEEPFNKRLSRALAEEMDAPVKLRSVSTNIVVFDAIIDGKKQTFRMGYHNENDEFMFGRSERVEAETVYMPINDDGPGHAFAEDDEKSLDDEIDLWIDDMIEFAQGDEELGSKVDEQAISAIAEIVSESVETKAGRVISSSNMEKLQQAITILREIAAAGGREDIEMKQKEEFLIESEVKELFDLRIHLEPIFEHYGAKTLCTDDGIVAHIDHKQADQFEQAIKNALQGFDNPLVDEIQVKGIGRAARRILRGGRGGGVRGVTRRAGRAATPNKPSYDGDGDGFITNPLNGRDEIPWRKGKESPEEAIEKFFRNARISNSRTNLGEPLGGTIRDSKRPESLRDAVSGKRPSSAMAKIDKIAIGDMFPENWDDESKPLGKPRFQVMKMRKAGEDFELELADITNGTTKKVKISKDGEVPDVVRPLQRPVERPTGPMEVAPTYQAAGRDLGPFDPRKTKPWVDKPKLTGQKPETAKPAPATNAADEVSWPLDNNGAFKKVEELSDDELSALADKWNGLSATGNPRIQQLSSELNYELNKRKTPEILDSMPEREDNNIIPIQKAGELFARLNWLGPRREGKYTPGEGGSPVESTNGDFGRYEIYETDDGKFIVLGIHKYDEFNNDYLDGDIEFESLDDAMDWVERFEEAFDDGNNYPGEEGFEWPDYTPSSEVQDLVNDGLDWRVPVDNKPAKGADGQPLAPKERSHNFISRHLEEARETFAKKWADRRKKMSIEENINDADERIQELESSAFRLDNAYINNFPGFEEAYSMGEVEFARMALDRGWVDSVMEGRLLHQETMDAWDQLGQDLAEINAMIDEISEARRKFVDDYNDKYEANWYSRKPDENFPSRYGE